jgi:hypothetical protein
VFADLEFKSASCLQCTLIDDPKFTRGLPTKLFAIEPCRLASAEYLFASAAK